MTVLGDPLLEAVSRAYAPSAPRALAGTWEATARPSQLPPAGNWAVWAMSCGRGWGKGAAASQWIALQARTYPGARIALVAATIADARDSMVEGETGLLSVLDDSELRGGNRDDAWNRSLGELFLANGTRFKTFSSEKPGRLRGPQHHFAWCDEAAQFLDAHKGTARDTTWSNMQFGLRLKARPDWPAGFRTRAVLTTTPRPVELLKVPDSVLAREPHRAGVFQLKTTRVVTGKTSENLDNLSETFRETVVEPMTGTTLGRQELDAEILEDLDGAFLPRTLIDQLHVRPGAAPPMTAVVVAIDPATTDGERSDETGIVVVGYGTDGLLYVLADHSLRASPDGWARAALTAAAVHGARCIVVEDNQGGDMVTHVLETTRTAMGRDLARRAHQGGLAAPSIVRVHPCGKDAGKWARAQTVRALYEQRKVRHVTRLPAPPTREEETARARRAWNAAVTGIQPLEAPESDPGLAGLEDQLCTWTGETRGSQHDDRIDALVHAILWLTWPGERRATHGRHLQVIRVPQQRWANAAGYR